MLLRFKPDQFLDVILVKRRQLHEPGENRLTRHGITDLLLLDLQGGRQLLDRKGDLRKTREILGRIREDTLRTVGFQVHSSGLGGIEDRHRYTLRSYAQGNCALCFSHDLN